MLQLKTFIFNDFGENTYLLYDETRDCVIIDPGAYSPAEKKELDDYITSNRLKISHVLCTHAHLDHILGAAHIEDNYERGLLLHPAGAEFLRASVGYASVFGFDLDRAVKPGGFINEGDIISFGHSALEMIYTPGHAEGSLCFIHHPQKMVFTGDVLFRESVGRTDLPTGDTELLMHSIKNKLFALPDDFTVYPGHGPESTIGYEKKHNPYL